MSCDPVTPNQQQILLVNWMNETQLFLLYFSASSISYEYYLQKLFFLINSFHVTDF